MILDQDVLNDAFKGAIGVLPPKIDVMTIAATHKYNEIQKLIRPTNYYNEIEIEEAVRTLYLFIIQRICE